MLEACPDPCGNCIECHSCQVCNCAGGWSGDNCCIGLHSSYLTICACSGHSPSLGKAIIVYSVIYLAKQIQ